MARRSLLLPFAAMLAGGPAVAEGIEERLTALGAEPCADSSFLCVTITVPRDHRANDPAETLPITYAIQPATELSRGTLVYAVGGPGGSGLALAESYASGFDPDLMAHFDLVFFDQRGVGPRHGVACPAAQSEFDRAAPALDDPVALTGVVGTFVEDCIEETGAAERLAYLGTDQAVRDLELFRQTLGLGPIWIYGESYGTQFAQTYATTFPTAVKGLILDGVVDLTLSSKGYYGAYIGAADRILSRVFTACDAHPVCSADMRNDAAKAFDALAETLARSPVLVDYPRADGPAETRALTAAMLETNAFFALYSPEGRAAFLRALAAASRGSHVPMLRLAYSNLYIDPETEDGIADPSFFGAAYYAVTCADYGDGAGTPEADAARIFADAAEIAVGGPRLYRSFVTERLVCAHWPVAGPEARPAPFAGGTYPTLILNADTDPITPVSMAYAVADQARNAAALVMQGGPHVIFGRGRSCPDESVRRLLMEDRLPEAAMSLCVQDFLAPYVPLSRVDEVSAPTAYSLALALRNEIEAHPDYQAWSGADELHLACDLGGTITASPGFAQAALSFAGCRFWPDIAIDGVGLVYWRADGSEEFTLFPRVSGRVSGELRYTEDRGAGTSALSGTWNGREVETPRPLP